MSDPILVCEGVEVAYGPVQILFGVDLAVERGEIVALLGTNGAGKSTLLKAVSQLVTPIGGRITFDGRDLTTAGPLAAAKAGIVQVPGGKATFPTLTVAEHFTMGTWLMRDEDPEQVRSRIDAVLERFPRIRERWSQQAGNLSGGEQQQLALGMAFVARPELLVIDELSLGLAPVVVEQLLDMVRAIHAEGTTIIVVEQSVNVALTIAERAYFMEKGEVRFEGPTAELLGRTDILRSVFLEGAGTSAGPAGAGPPATPVARPAISDVAGPVLVAEGLRKSFGGITAVDGAHFTLHEGEILGLIGPNGAGKTTIFDLVSGILDLDAGTLTFAGADITSTSAHRRAQLGLGRSFQDARIFPSMTVAENIAFALERHLEHRDHVAAALSLPAIAQMEDDIAYSTNDLIELLHLGAFRDKFVSELSTGSRRIVDLAMALAHDPKVLLLDEPSSGVAQKETEALGPLLHRIKDETGCSLLIIEHDMPLMTAVCDRLVALELGAVVTAGPPDEVLADERVVSAYLGSDLDVINRSGA
ncbi:MAG TPA: ATP-binding cassette domain-containing protein [Acidimicrobiales bacterium]|nr:ATP-binding cassette domain-containing protein [Acidimicrobiales bacterium]